MKGLLKSPPYGHALTYRFHGGGQQVLGACEFFKGPSRYLDHTIIDSGLKRGQSFPGNIIRDFIQGIPYREFGRYLGDRETSGL